MANSPESRGGSLEQNPVERISTPLVLSNGTESGEVSIEASSSCGVDNSGYQPNFVHDRDWVHSRRKIQSTMTVEQVSHPVSSHHDSGAVPGSRGHGSTMSPEQMSRSGQIGEESRNVGASEIHVTVTGSSNSPTTQAGMITRNSDPLGQTNSSLTNLTNNSIATGQSIQTQDLNVGVVVNRMDRRHEALPDILHSHVVPSHPQSRQGQHPPGGHSIDPRGHPHSHQAHVRHHPRDHHHRDGRHRSRRSRNRRRSRSTSQSEDEPCKDGCMKCMAAITSFRWILVILSLLGVCCVITGIVLAALHAAGNSFLFLAIMFIGLGVLLVIVVAVGWKCTPRGHEPLHALFGLGDFRRPRERRSRSRHHGRRSRESQWYGGVMYPEFQYRRPPPSYNASMQDFQHQLVLAQSQRERFHSTDELPAEDYSLPSSPPPSYRSRASTIRTGIQITFPPMQGEHPDSRPPTYRSHIDRSGQSHSRPSLPRDDDYIRQGGDIAFDGQQQSNSTESNTQQHSRNNSTGPAVVQSQTVSVSVTDNASVSVSSPQTSGSAIVASANLDTSQDELLDNMVQQTLQTLDAATSSGGQENTRGNTNGDDDEYPMETPL